MRRTAIVDSMNGTCPGCESFGEPCETDHLLEN